MAISQAAMCAAQCARWHCREQYCARWHLLHWRTGNSCSEGALRFWHLRHHRCQIFGMGRLPSTLHLRTLHEDRHITVVNLHGVSRVAYAMSLP